VSSLFSSGPGVFTADGGVNVEVVKALRLNRASLDVSAVGASELKGCGVDCGAAGPVGEVLEVFALSWLRSRVASFCMSGLALSDVVGARVGVRGDVVDEVSGVDGPLYLRS
jgi:hypothetical protein